MFLFHLNRADVQRTKFYSYFYLSIRGIRKKLDYRLLGLVVGGAVVESEDGETMHLVP